MKIAICDLCNIEKDKDGNKKLVESKYRWGFKGGFKLDLCHFHTKINNPFKGMSPKDAEAKFYKMRFGTDEPTEKALMERLAHAGDNVGKEA